MIKTITLKYDLKNFKELETIKGERGLSWEDLAYAAIINYRRKAVK